MRTQLLSIISKRPSISWLAFWTITILVWFGGQIDSNSLNSFMSQIPQWVKGKRKQCDILYSSEITFSACVKEGKCVADIFRLKFPGWNVCAFTFEQQTEWKQNHKMRFLLFFFMISGGMLLVLWLTTFTAWQRQLQMLSHNVSHFQSHNYYYCC